MSTQYRHPAFNRFGSIDVEIAHADHGWIPFTASPDDDQEFGRALHAEIVAAGDIAPYVPPEPQAEPVPEEISRRQFCQGLAVAGLITKPEAIAFIQGAALPAAMQTIVDGMTDEDAAFEATMLLLGAGSFFRSHPLVLIFAMAQSMTETQVDDFWRLCASL